MSEDTKTYLLETKGGKKKRLTLPASYSLTFGPTIPYQRGHSPDSSAWSLRIYREAGKKQLAAIFTDVKSFRDMDLGITEQRVRTKRQVMEKASTKGGKAVVAEARIEEWIDPDEPDTEDSTPSEYLSLEHKTDDDEVEVIDF